jgi:hypothetical protein
VRQEEIEIEVKEIRRLVQMAEPFFAAGAQTADFETRIQLYKDIDTTDDDVEQLMVEASNGNAFAKSLLCFLALARLSKADKPLDRWIFSLLKEQAAKRKGGRGRHPSSKKLHSFVSYAVSQVLKRHPELHRSKGRSSKTKITASSIVSRALVLERINLGASRVAEIFKEQQKSRLV